MSDTTGKALDALLNDLNAVNRNYELARGVHHTIRSAHTAITALRIERDAAIAREKALLASNQEERTALVEAASLRRERDALRSQLATARADAVRDAAEAANEADSLELALHGPAKIVERILALIDTPTPSAPSPEAVARAALPLDEWHEDIGNVTWWEFPISEPAWIGTPLDSDWPGYHTHFTAHPPIPSDPATLAAIVAKAGGGE
jgi:hypothetical protein